MSLEYGCGGIIKCYKNYYKAKISLEWYETCPVYEHLENNFELHRKIILPLLDEMSLADDNRSDWEPHIELGEWAQKMMNKCRAVKKLTLEDTRTGRFVKVVRD